MNVVSTFLLKNWQRLPVRHLGEPKRFSCVMATPRFKASRHIIFFILADGHKNPVLVAKVPRRSGDNCRLDLEAKNLSAVHGFRAEGFSSIPRVIAYEDYFEERLLIETMLVGRPMNRTETRRRSESCIETIAEWLLALQGATSTPSDDDPEWFERLVEQPLMRMRDLMPLSLEDEHLLDRTAKLTAALRFRDLPLTFVHGDLSHPNVLLLSQGGPGVVDWELAEPRSLPATDFFFFLSYVAFARQLAEKNADYVSAFHKAFFGPRAWARPHIENYVKQVPLASDVVVPLFLLTWARYVDGLMSRLHDEESSSMTSLKAETAEWLRSNRYYALWRHAIEHVQELNLTN